MGLAADPQRKVIYDKTAQNSGPALFKRHGGGARDSAMSFIFLTESQMSHSKVTPPNSTTPAPKSERGRRDSANQPDQQSHEPLAEQTYEMTRLSKLFEILSARSDIDHPICVECTELLMVSLERKLDAAIAERDAYVRFLKSVQAEQPSEEELRAQQEALRKARADEADAMADLLRLEREQAAADAELLALEDETKEMDKEEEQFWRERNAFASRLDEVQSEKDSITSRLDHDTRLYQRLMRTNVYNDTFCISHDGTFATINGLRLGRLSSKPVDWPEINAAWGHALLLIVTVAEKLGYRFEGYEPQPMGSTSKIIRVDTAQAGGPARPKKHILELYSSGDMLGLITINRSLNSAMVAFLELVRQLGEFVRQQMQRQGASLGLPYRIEGDRIRDVSIRLGIGADESWTEACKLTLTCCKFLLAHASFINYNARDPTT